MFAIQKRWISEVKAIYKLSIIIPVYNVEKYVKRAINSALAQGDFEIIVIDDGSTDGSGALCDGFVSDGVRVIHTENGGLAAARNCGLAAALGEYVCFLDSDDYLDEGAAEHMLSLAKSENADIVICGFYTEYEGSAPVPKLPDRWSGNAHDMGAKFIALKRSHLFDSACNKLYKTDFLNRNSLRFGVGEIFEDTDFNLRAFEKNPVLSVSDACFYHYIQRQEGSITKSYNPAKLDTMLKRSDSLYDYCEAHCKEALGYCGIYYFKSLFSSVADTFLPSVGRQRRRQMLKSAFSDSRFARAAATAEGRGAEGLFALFARTGNVSASLLLCYALYVFKYRIKPLLK